VGISQRLKPLLTGIAGAAGMIAVITVLSRAVGFVRWFVQSATLGDSATANAYSTANMLPNVLFEVAAGGALAGVVIPLLAAPLARGVRRDVDRISGALVGWTLLVLVPLGALVAIFAAPIAALLPDSVGSDIVIQHELATYFLRVFAVQIPLYGIGVVLTGILQAQRRFFFPAIAPLASSCVVIVAYLGFGMLSGGNADNPAQLAGAALHWLAWGTTLGVAAMSLPLLVPVLRSGVRLRPTLRLPPGVGRRALALAGAGLGALLAQQLSVVVFIFLARAGGVEGTITIWQYAQAVYFLPYAVLAVPVATAVFPRLAEHAQRDPRRFTSLAATSTRLVLVASVVGGALLVAAAPAATAVFSLRGEMAGMTEAIVYLAPGVAGFALIFHVSRALYALDEGRSAVLATASGWLAASGAALLGVRWLAPDGGDGPATLRALAAATTLGMTLAGLALLLALRRAAGPRVLRGLGRTLLAAGGGGVLGALLGRLLVRAVLAATDASLAGGLVAAALGSAVAAALTVGVVWVADRSVLPGSRAAQP